MTTAVTSSVLDKINGATPKPANATDEAGSSERFLKLLVTQMQNQDPLNPMDNAQVTSQIAQINTVSGIAKLNTTVEGLSGQYVQMQALQGASLIGKEVVVPGNKLSIENGTGEGGYELASPADRVKIEVLGANKQVVDTIDLGAQGAGMHSFQWPVGTKTDGVTFRVTATSGGTALSPTALMRDTVTSVSTAGNELHLDLAKSGDTAYSKVKALN
jgi:flagellar basal-body rod modification protein FlgD